jgi:5-enolpyruvylshikimate-3-phosphate synthase
MSAAALAEGIEIKISDELVSQPYVDMTVKLMERFGVKVGAWGGRAGGGGLGGMQCSRSGGNRGG